MVSIQKSQSITKELLGPNQVVFIEMWFFIERCYLDAGDLYDRLVYCFAGVG